MKLKFTKEMIEQFAYDIMKYLTKHHLDSDVCIYFNNKRIRHEYDWRSYNPSPKLIVEENISPVDYFEYVNYDHILSMSFEGPLYESMNYSGKHMDGLHELFEKYGVYWELGDSWNLSAYPIDDDLEIEFTAYARPKQKKELYMWDTSIPTVLRRIMDTWYKLSELEGDKGSCVVGAGYNFTWEGDDYFMCACSPYQGSISWEENKDVVRMMLQGIGATDIIYDFGRMD